MESIFNYVSKGNSNVPTRTLRNWYDHYIEWGEPPHETTTKQHRYNNKITALRRTNVVTDKIVDTLPSILIGLIKKWMILIFISIETNKFTNELLVKLQFVHFKFQIKKKLKIVALPTFLRRII